MTDKYTNEFILAGMTKHITADMNSKTQYYKAHTANTYTYTRHSDTCNNY